MVFFVESRKIELYFITKRRVKGNLTLISFSLLLQHLFLVVVSLLLLNKLLNQYLNVVLLALDELIHLLGVDLSFVDALVEVYNLL